MDLQDLSPVLMLGITGSAIFYGRFLVQWIVSEKKKQSVVPKSFWYMSAVGSVMLLTYGILNRSLLGTLGQNINVIIYGRNITHIWREEGTLTRKKSGFLLLFMSVFAIIGLIAVIQLAIVEWRVLGEKTPSESRVAWGWLILGLIGQALFAARFILQWLATERAKKSVIPKAFWFISFFAASFQCAAFLQRDQLVFAIGMGFTVFIYARNIWFIYTPRPEAQSGRL